MVGVGAGGWRGVGGGGMQKGLCTVLVCIEGEVVAIRQRAPIGVLGGPGAREGGGNHGR
jgi:hypothetical protein